MLLVLYDSSKGTFWAFKKTVQPASDGHRASLGARHVSKTTNIQTIHSTHDISSNSPLATLNSLSAELNLDTAIVAPNSPVTTSVVVGAVIRLAQCLYTVLEQFYTPSAHAAPIRASW